MNEGLKAILTLVTIGVWITSIVIFCDFTFAPHPFKWWWWKRKDKILMTAYLVSIFLIITIPILVLIL